MPERKEQERKMLPEMKEGTSSAKGRRERGNKEKKAVRNLKWPTSNKGRRKTRQMTKDTGIVIRDGEESRGEERRARERKIRRKYKKRNRNWRTRRRKTQSKLKDM